MTVSFHRYGQQFFPGSGNIDEIGFGAGKYHTLNIPFESGLTDSQFWSVFKPVMQKVMEVYQPGAIVLQCGGSAYGTFSMASHCLRRLLTDVPWFSDQIVNQATNSKRHLQMSVPMDAALYLLLL